jgi:hypothetical protein
MIDDNQTAWPINLRRKDAARYLSTVHGIPVQPGTLAQWFHKGSGGPPAYKAGRFPLYPRHKLDEWAAARLGELRIGTPGTSGDTGGTP